MPGQMGKWVGQFWWEWVGQRRECKGSAPFYQPNSLLVGLRWHFKGDSQSLRHLLRGRQLLPTWGILSDLQTHAQKSLYIKRKKQLENESGAFHDMGPKEVFKNKKEGARCHFALVITKGDTESHSQINPVNVEFYSTRLNLGQCT